MTKNKFYLYRLRSKVGKYDAFDTWFRTPKLAFAPMKAKFNKYGKGTREHYDPKNYEAVEYEIKEVQIFNVDEG
jgi:hypothetical protein